MEPYYQEFHTDRGCSGKVEVPVLSYNFENASVQGNELSENIIAFALVQEDILNDLQANKDLSEYSIKHMNLSLPLRQQIQRQRQSFSSGHSLPLPLYSFASGVHTANDRGDHPGLGYPPKKSELNYTHTSCGQKLPKPQPVVRHSIPTAQEVAQQPMSKVSKTEDCMWVMIDDDPEEWDRTISNRIKLTKLPCCTEYASEMTCISSKVLPQKCTVASASTDQETDHQDGRFQNQLQRTCEVYDEIQNQLKAISFVKPELLTSSATLGYINTSKIGTSNDILRRTCTLHCPNINQFLCMDKKNDNNNPSNRSKGPLSLNASRGRKPLKQLIDRNYIPRSPLAFEKLFDLSSSELETTMAQNSNSTPIKEETNSFPDPFSKSEVRTPLTPYNPRSILGSNSNGSNSKFNCFSQKKRIGMNSNGSNLANTASKTSGSKCKKSSNLAKMMSLANVKSKLTAPAPRKIENSGKLTSRDFLQATSSDNLVAMSPSPTPSSSTLPLSTSAVQPDVVTAPVPTPVRKSPFEWLDTYFA